MNWALGTFSHSAPYRRLCVFSFEGGGLPSAVSDRARLYHLAVGGVTHSVIGGMTHLAAGGVTHPVSGGMDHLVWGAESWLTMEWPLDSRESGGDMERLSMHRIVDLVYRLRQGQSLRAIGRDLGHSRVTLRHYRELARAPGLSGSRPALAGAGGGAGGAGAGALAAAQ